MRHFLLSTAAAGAVLAAAAAVPASAADLPVRAAPAPVYAPVAPFTWTGCYVGANAGVAWNSHGDDDFFAHHRYAGLNPPILFANNVRGVGAGFPFHGQGHDIGNDHGFTGGLQAGCNWQAGAFVFGIESDINYIDTGSDDFSFGAAGITYQLPPAFGPGSRQTAGIAVGPLGLPSGIYNAFWSDNNGDDHGHLLTTTRARVGVAFDRFLVYVTGGVAFRDGGDDDHGVAFVTNAIAQRNFFGQVVPAGAIATTISGGPAIYGGFNGDDNNNIGGVAGGGFEWALTNNVTVRLEYLHLFFGDNNGHRIDPILTSYFGTPIAFDNGDDDGDVDIVRAGLNIKFGSLFGPY